MTTRTWDRRLWGVVLMHRMPGERDTMLGSLWDAGVGARYTYPGEPVRKLLFQTRKACRAWIEAHRGEYFGKRYRCVRVRERVEVV